MKRITWSACGLFLLVLVHGLGHGKPGANTAERSLDVGGRQRSYLLHVPPGIDKTQPLPLVLVFHGGGSNAVGMERLTKFSDLADRERFLVAYPDGVEENWYDGREIANTIAHKEKIDDVGFVAAMLDAIARDYPVDAKRVYATGISNGGIFSHYLAANLSTRVAAIAPVVGGIADPFHEKFAPKQPVSVMILQGTVDPLTPYDGGGIARGRRGKIIATEKAVDMWSKHNGCGGKPTRQDLPDKNSEDGCKVQRTTYREGKGGTEVVLYRIVGGGHTWPGGAQYLPEKLIGKVCRDFDATTAIWDFFKQHPKQ